MGERETASSAASCTILIDVLSSCDAIALRRRGGKGVAQQLANISDELGASLEQWSTFFLWEARSSQVCARPFVAQKIA